MLSNVGQRTSKPIGTSRPKRSVRISPERYPNWQRLCYYYDKCPSPLHRHIFLSLLFTGCRVSELIQLRRDQIVMNPHAIYVFNAPVLKHKAETTRTIQITRHPDNRLIRDFADYIKACDTVYLIPGTQQFTGSVLSSEPTTRSTIYRKVREIDDNLFPHLLRGWCAGRLVEEYSFNVFDLQTWFEWASADTPAFYARTREKEIAAKLGILEEPEAPII